MIISQSTADRFFPGEDPIGHRIDWGESDTDDVHLWREIVGVVADVRRWGLGRPPADESYVPLEQRGNWSMVLVARSPRAESLLKELPAIVQSVDPDQAIQSRRLMRDRVAETVGNQRYVALLLGAFALSALFLATIGIFGLVSYSTSQRTRELGIRMALGSTPESVVLLVLKSGLRLLAWGLGVGAVLAIGVGRIIASRVAGVAPYDLPADAAIVAVLAVSGVLACLVPAWRAAAVPPAIALRYE
jgi:predicted lysophospholipase L1 biosynthesis ABC-type transport system permease subunit